MENSQPYILDNIQKILTPEDGYVYHAFRGEPTFRKDGSIFFLNTFSPHLSDKVEAVHNEYLSDLHDAVIEDNQHLEGKSYEEIRKEGFTLFKVKSSCIADAKAGEGVIVPKGSYQFVNVFEDSCGQTHLIDEREIKDKANYIADIEYNIDNNINSDYNNESNITLATLATFSEDELRAMANKIDLGLRFSITRHPKLSEDLIRTLAADKDFPIREAIADHPGLPEDVIRTLATDEYAGARRVIAERPNLPEDIIRNLAADKNSFVRVAIADRADLPEDLIHTLAVDEDWQVRAAIAKRADLSEDLIRTLAADEDSDVRYFIAGRADLPEDLIRTLAVDKNYKVRAAITERTDLPEDLLRYSGINRYEIIRKADLPEDLIRTLAADEDSDVRKAIAKRTDLPEDLIHTLAADEEYPTVREAIANRANLSEDLIRTLAADEDSNVRFAIAGRADLPEDLIRTLAVDRNWSVRIAIAQCADLPEDAFRTLAADEDPDICLTITERKDLPEDVVRTLAANKNSFVRKTIAKRADLPEDLIHTLAVDEDSDVRAAIARRSDLPEDILSAMTATANEIKSAREDLFSLNFLLMTTSEVDVHEIPELIENQKFYSAYRFSFSPELRERMVIGKDERKALDELILIHDNPHCLPELRLQAQKEMLMGIKANYSHALDNCEAVYPDTQDKIWKYPPYAVTDIHFRTPAYADGLPLDKCPGWMGSHPGWGHIDSITIKDGNGSSKIFSGSQIDENNRLTFEQDDMTIKYEFATGKTEFFPHLKVSIDQNPEPKGIKI